MVGRVGVGKAAHADEDARRGRLQRRAQLGLRLRLRLNGGGTEIGRSQQRGADLRGHLLRRAAGRADPRRQGRQVGGGVGLDQRLHLPGRHLGRRGELRDVDDDAIERGRQRGRLRVGRGDVVGQRRCAHAEQLLHLRCGSRRVQALLARHIDDERGQWTDEHRLVASAAARRRLEHEGRADRGAGGRVDRGGGHVGDDRMLAGIVARHLKTIGAVGAGRAGRGLAAVALAVVVDVVADRHARQRAVGDDAGDGDGAIAAAASAAASRHQQRRRCRNGSDRERRPRVNRIAVHNRPPSGKHPMCRMRL